MVTSRVSSTQSRRTYLSLVGGTLGVSLAGCLGNASERVRVLSAGSLAQTFEDHVGPAFESETGIEVQGEYYGSNAIVRMIQDETKHPDVVVSADASLLRDRLYDDFADWDVEFAANSLGIAYAPETPLGKRLEAGDPWYEAVRDLSEGEFAVSDPDLDPLGYRAYQAFELAEREHDLTGFRDELEDLVYEEPEEPQLLAGVDTGARAGAVAYRNMAVDHGLPFFEFPPEYDFAHPDLEDHYATVSFTTDDGYTAAGRPILYNATVVHSADHPDAGHRLVQFLVDNPDVLDDAGLTVTDALPRPTGSVPEAIQL